MLNDNHLDRAQAAGYDAPMAETEYTRRKRGPSRPELAEGEYTVDDLAQRTQSTVRNIRAYQDKGVLPPPEKRGRLGVYKEHHVSRLHLINNLLDRGFSIGNIKELLEAWVTGRELGDLLGFEHAITHAFSSEQPRAYSISELLKKFGLSAVRKDLIEEAVSLKLIKRKGTKLVAESPSLIDAGAELTSLGMPFEEMLELLRLLRGNVQRAANNLVDTAFSRFDTFGDGELPPKEDIQELSDLVWKLRPIAHTAIRAEAEMALNRAIQERLGDRLMSVLQNLQSEQ